MVDTLIIPRGVFLRQWLIQTCAWLDGSIGGDYGMQYRLFKDPPDPTWLIDPNDFVECDFSGYVRGGAGGGPWNVELDEFNGFARAHQASVFWELEAPGLGNTVRGINAGMYSPSLDDFFHLFFVIRHPPEVLSTVGDLYMWTPEIVLGGVFKKS